MQQSYHTVLSFSFKNVTIDFVLAYEIWGFMKFNEQCEDNLRRSEEMLRNMDQNKKNMTRTMDSINKLEADLDKVRSEDLIYFPYSINYQA